MATTRSTFPSCCPAHPERSFSASIRQAYAAKHLPNSVGGGVVCVANRNRDPLLTMSDRTVYQGISNRARQLLSAGESKHVDYKSQLRGLHAEDLVAFANSSQGGAILVGVEEQDRPDGAQIGVPCGCDIGDDEKLDIMSKALSCIPPVAVEIVVENLRELPFYRIEIPSSSSKPHATSSGTYKIRTDGRNQPLLPDQLLSLFLDKEGEAFRSRFTRATGDLEKRMDDTLEVVSSLECVIEAKITEIESSLGKAECEVNDSGARVADVNRAVATLLKMVEGNSEQLSTLLKSLGADGAKS